METNFISYKWLNIIVTYVIKQLNRNIKRHILNTKPHMDLSESRINKNCVKKTELTEIEEIIQKHVNNYNKKFEF